MPKIKNYWIGLEGLKILVDNLSGNEKITPTMSIDKIQENYEIYYAISTFIDKLDGDKINQINIDGIKDELNEFKNQLNEIADEFYNLASSLDIFYEKLKNEKNNSKINKNSLIVNEENFEPENNFYKNQDEINKNQTKANDIIKPKNISINTPTKVNKSNEKINNSTIQPQILSNQIFINLLLKQKKFDKVFSFTSNNMIYLNDKYRSELKGTVKFLQNTPGIKINETVTPQDHRVILKIYKIPTNEAQKIILSLKKFGILLDRDFK
jgi:hypothetical protein